MIGSQHWVESGLNSHMSFLGEIQNLSFKFVDNGKKVKGGGVVGVCSNPRAMAPIGCIHVHFVVW